jgi:transposase-like protein
MSQKSSAPPARVPAEKLVRDIRRAPRKHHSAEDKIRIVLEGLRAEEGIAALCRREAIAESPHYAWSKEFLGEFGAQDDEITVILRERLGELESFFRRCLRAAQREGTVAQDMNIPDIARLILAAVMGLRVLARARPEPALLDGAARGAIALLGPRPARA